MIDSGERGGEESAPDVGVQSTVKLQVVRDGALRRAGDDAISVGDKVSHNAVRSRLFGGAPEPTRIGRFVIVRKIGAGGMGVVYSAYDEELDRKVAIKLLHRESKGSEGRARIVREAQALARISHPNIVHVYEVGEWQDQVFMAMEFVEGETLDTWARAGRSWREILATYLDAAEGLAAAHEAGLIHRDVKPENLLLSARGRVKILDFGLARIRPTAEAEATTFDEREGAGATRSGPAAPSPAELSRTLTAAGAVVGTPAYMSPEQCSGLAVNARSDLFSFCVALYEGLYGERPFQGRNLPLLVTAICNGEVRDAPRGTKVPPRLRRVLLRGLEVDPARRWPSMRDLITALRDDPSRRRRRWLSAVGGLALVAGAAAAWLPAVDGGRCGGGAAHLAGIWDSARKAEIGGAIAASGVGYAEETWTLAQRRLDSYADQWLTAYNGACLGHQAGDTSDELYDRQIACLDGRLLELEATSKVLAEIDASALPQVNELIAVLPPIDTCADTEALRDRFAPPADARQARAVDNIRRDLTEVRAKNNAGYHREVHEDAKALVLAARESGYRPVLAEALFEYGEVLYGEHRHPEAEPVYLEALLTADGVRHDDVAARAGTRLVFNLGWYQSRPEEALIRAQHVRTILERLGPGHVAEAELENALGAIAYANADYAEARQHFERGKALTESLTLERPPWIRFFILLNLGEICEAQGDIPCMEQSTAKALAEVEAEYGADHPRISFFLLRMARVRVSQGRIDDARALLQRMIEHSAATFGEDHPQHGMTVWQASGVLLWAGKLAESEALFDTLGAPDDPKVDHDVWFHLRRSELQELHGDLKGALASVEAATAEGEPGEGASPRSLQMSRNRHSYLLNRHGRHDEAAALAEAALAEVEKTYGPDHPGISAPLTNLARAKIGSGEFDVAADHLARALAVVEERAPEHWKLLDPLEAKAELALELGEPEVAIESARRALKILSKHACVPYRKASFGLQLARAQVAAGRGRDEVMATIDEALAHADAVDGANAIKGKIDAWLAGYRATAGADLTPDLDARG